MIILYPVSFLTIASYIFPQITEKYLILAKAATAERLKRAFVGGVGFGGSNMSLFLTYTLLFW
jgi:hypothetical protein